MLHFGNLFGWNLLAANGFRLTLCAVCVVSFLLEVGRSPCALAADYHNGFDDSEVSWQLRVENKHTRVVTHQRGPEPKFAGMAAEILSLDSATDGALVRLEHELPPSRRIDDLELSVSVRSNRIGLTVALRIVMPHERNPLTGEVLQTFVGGGQYKDANGWQDLRCTATERQLAEKLALLRERFKSPNLDTRDMYVDQVILVGRLGRGETEIAIDELRFGPLVPLKPDVPLVPSADDQTSDQVPVRFRSGQLLIDGRPFFPRIARDQGEAPDQLKAAGLNLIWVNQWDDRAAVSQLREQGLWIMATPPRVAAESSDTTREVKRASLLPFGRESLPILIWYLGTRISPESRTELLQWIDQIESADRAYRRPLMADISGLEWVYSRHIPLTGMSRHVVNTSFGMNQYRDWLMQKRKLSLPGSFLWTWVQTEPSATIAKWRENARKAPIVVEPEQIRLQVYSALAAGSRGIGYWNHTRLDGDGPGAKERRLAITQLNLELELLAPWLSTGTLVPNVPFQVSDPGRKPTPKFGQTGTGDQNPGDGLEFEAAVLRSEFGLLLLPIWYDNDAQLVPGRMAANDVTIVVPGVADSATAWEITTTGILSLPTRRVTGGTEISLRRFDQTAAVVLTSNQDWISQLSERVKDIRERSAQTCLSLAQAKFERVQQVDQELRTLGASQSSAPYLLSGAAESLQLGEAAFRRHDYHGARQRSADAMQRLRILQHAHWESATRKLSSPVSSPHTVCFQTLPDHWRLMESLGRSRTNLQTNLLRSGDFEDIDTMVVEHWRHEQGAVEGVHATAELYPVPHTGNYSLRLAAGPARGKDAPMLCPESPVTVETPNLSVRTGQILHVSGWMRVAVPITATLEGATLTDNVTGPAGAIRWHRKQDWTYFELLHEVHGSGDFRIKISLNGLGEIQVDDLKVVPFYTPTGGSEADPPDSEGEPGESRPGALEFLQRLPKLRPSRDRE